MWDHLGIVVAYALICAMWLDSRRRDRVNAAKVMEMQTAMNGFEQERLELRVAIRGFESSIRDQLRPIEAHLKRQDELQGELMSLTKDAVNQLANLRKGKAPH